MNFDIVPEKICLPAYEAMDIYIKYTPTTLRDIEYGELRLSHPNVGQWIFKVCGRGLPPSEPQPILSSCPIGDSASSSVSFKNPFKEQVHVTVELQESPEIEPETFKLLLRRTKFTISPLAILQIPFGYSPVSMREHHAIIIVSITEELTWRYTVRGIAEKGKAGVDYYFRTRARQKIEKELNIFLMGIEDMVQEENFEHELVIPNQDLQSLVNKSFKLELLKNIVAGPNDPIEFHALFEPLRPFKTTIELYVIRPNGGR